MEPGNGNEDNPIIGYYKNGDPIHQHPSEDEIRNHVDEWWDLARRIMSKEQFEIIDEMRNIQINTHFKRQSEKLTDEQTIELAIKWWMEQYPWEVKPFFTQVDIVKQNLFNAKGYAAGDKDRSMVMYGMIPDKVKTLCLAHHPEFWHKDKKGKCKNIERFYQLCPNAKISSMKGSA